MAGRVRVADQIVEKPSMQFEADVEITLDASSSYVSRGGDKLVVALQAFSIPVEKRVCADVGASTGGFTHCLLEHGASRVYAIDVGHGILHWRLRNDPRVVVMERTNARYLESLPEAIGLVTVDVSFISLGLILPAVRSWLASHADVLALIKPQFEAGREAVGRRGVVRDPDVRRRVVEQVMQYARQLNLSPQGLMPSPLLGPKGNVEFFLWCRLGGEELGPDLMDPLTRLT